MSPEEIATLPPMDLAFGELREKLVAAVISGEKTATTSLHQSYLAEDQPLPQPGLQRLLGREDETVGLIEITDVSLRRLGEVDDEIAFAEGEGYASVAEWRASHEGFWHSVGEAEPGTLTDDSLIVVERFRLVTTKLP